jgi:hypothetical protein
LRLYGDEQRRKGFLSSLHSKFTFASSAEKANLALRFVRPLGTLHRDETHDRDAGDARALSRAA